MGGPWFKPNTDSAAGKARRPEEVWKKCPCEWADGHEGAALSLGLPVCVCSHELFSPLRNTLPVSLLSISLWKFIFYKATQARVLSLVWRLGFGAVTAAAWLQSWPGTEVLFQVAAGRGHLRSRPIRNLWYFRWGLVIQLGASYHIMRRVWGDDQAKSNHTFSGKHLMDPGVGPSK